MLARAAAVLAGAGLYTLALPPFDLAALAWLAVAPLLLAVRGGSVRAGFAWGLLYGCAFGWGVTWWSVQAVARYFAVGAPLALLALQAFYVAVFAPTFGLFGAGATVLLRLGRPWARRLAVPALWVATELVRGRLLGQPWGLLGYSQHGHVELIQVAALTGVYGVSFLLVLANAAVFEVLLLARTRRPRPALAALGLAAVAVGGVSAAGRAVLVRGDAEGFAARPVAVVQSGVAPAYEWTRAYAERQLAAHLRTTAEIPPDLRPGLVVWPENAVTQYLESDPRLAATLAAAARRRGADLLFGAPRYEAGRTFNSVRLIGADGRNGGHYDKQHLVLFAEAGLLTGPAPAAPDESPRRFSAGREPGLLHSFVVVGPSICHEVIYPELVNRSVRAGAEMLVNVSNDGWLDRGHGAASRQHFAMAAFRAVETRRALVRAASTGISGIVDPYGRVVAALEPGAVGVAAATVAGRADLTPYVRLGDAFAFACLLAAAAALSGVRPAWGWRRRPLAPAPTA